jgi:hypothetical protein
MVRAVARFWSNMNLSDKDSGGSFVGDQIYATGLYRLVSLLKASAVRCPSKLTHTSISPTETSLFLFILRERCLLPPIFWQKSLIDHM